MISRNDIYCGFCGTHGEPCKTKEEALNCSWMDGDAIAKLKFREAEPEPEPRKMYPSDIREHFAESVCNELGFDMCEHRMAMCDRILVRLYLFGLVVMEADSVSRYDPYGMDGQP